jgi:molybdate transport system regulatory protein
MNILPGKIIEIKVSGNLVSANISVSGELFTSLLTAPEFPYESGEEVNLLFKETEVSIGKNISGSYSIRNRFRGTIERVVTGEILTEITLKFKGYSINSLITTASAIEMDIKSGDEAEGFLKSNELMLIRKK